MHDRELALITVASKNGGCFDRRHALEAGYSPSAIQRRLTNGRWLRLGGGVMRAAETLPSTLMRQQAALTALGPNSFLSHGSGAAWHGLARPPRSIWCSVPHAQRGLHLPGVVVTRTHHIDFVVRNEIRVARPERAFCDLAMVLDRHELAAVLAAGVQAGKLRLDTVAEVAGQLFGRPGSTDLATVIAEFQPEFESTLGREFHELIAAAGIPDVTAGFVIHLPDGRFRVADGAIESLRLDLESDGFAYHGMPEQIQADKMRDRELAMHLWRTARFTTIDIRQHRERTMAELPRIVAARAREIGVWR